jgi:hypothetical protein
MPEVAQYATPNVRLHSPRWKAGLVRRPRIEHRPGPKDRRPALASPLAEARSCDDHLAGRLGVSVLDALIDRKALTPPGPDGVVHLGEDAADVFADLGIDVSAAATSRRRLTFACVHWTERRAHLGGALGAALLSRLLDQGWLRRQRDSRALLTTTAGRKGLQSTFGISKPALSSERVREACPRCSWGLPRGAPRRRASGPPFATRR